MVLTLMQQLKLDFFLYLFIFLILVWLRRRNAVSHIPLKFSLSVTLDFEVIEVKYVECVL